MERARGALLDICDWRPNLRAKEADLQKLRETSAMMVVEDVDSEVEEVDEEEEASMQDIHDPCDVALTSLEARYATCKGSVQVAFTSTVHAYADALSAVVVTVIVQECERELKQSTATVNRVVARVRIAAPLGGVTNIF
jgi:hypothetical protein